MTALIAILASLLWVEAQQSALAPLFTLGTGESSGPTAFGRVLDAELDQEGVVYVLDGMNAQVRVFSPTGTHRSNLGGRGGGPGEFQPQSLRAVAFVGGRLVVTEASGRVTWFGATGGLLGSQRLPLVGIGRAIPLSPSLWVVLRSGLSGLGGIEADQVLGLVRDGELVRLLSGASGGVFWRGGGETMALRSPVCQSLHLVTGPGGGFMVADGHSGLLRPFSASGEPAATIRVTEAAAPLSRERERELRGLAEASAQGRGVRAPEVVLPRYESTICGLEADGEDRVWIRLAREQGSAEVWRPLQLPAGRIGDTVRLPAGMRGVAIRNGRLAAIASDDLGVESVHVFRLHASRE